MIDESTVYSALLDAEAAEDSNGVTLDAICRHVDTLAGSHGVKFRVALRLTALILEKHVYQWTDCGEVKYSSIGALT